MPAELIAALHKEADIKAQVTLRNNEAMICKLRATGAAGFDLAQPSQDHITGALQEIRIDKLLEPGKVHQSSPRSTETMQPDPPSIDIAGQSTVV